MRPQRDDRNKAVSDYFGRIDHVKSLIHCSEESKITADLYIARDDKENGYRLAIAYGSGKYEKFKGKYYRCKSESDAKEKWRMVINE